MSVHTISTRKHVHTLRNLQEYQAKIHSCFMRWHVYTNEMIFRENTFKMDAS